jgi:hypothetical protein
VRAASQSVDLYFMRKNVCTHSRSSWLQRTGISTNSARIGQSNKQGTLAELDIPTHQLKLHS